MSRRLATIEVNAPIEFDLEAARWNDFDQNKVVKLFSELEFKSLLPRLSDLIKKEEKKLSSVNGGGTSLSMVDKFERNRQEFKYILVDDDKKFEKFFKELSLQKEFAVDTETTSLDPMACELLGVSFSWKQGEAYFVEVRSNHRRCGAGQLEVRKVRKEQKQKQGNLFDVGVGATHVVAQTGNVLAVEDEQTLRPSSGQAHGQPLQRLKPILENPKIKKYGHNMKYDIRVLKHAGIDLQGIAFDTMIASYLLNPGTRQHNLDALTFTELGFTKISKEDLLGTGRDKISFGEVEVEKLSLYSCEDADFTFRLVKKLESEITQNDLVKLFQEIEMPLVPVLVEMEENGIEVNKKFLEKMSKKVSALVEGLEEKIHALAGTKFNVGSPKQMQEILFDKLEISTANVSRIKTGLSTSAADLARLKDEHAIIPLIQEYRELTKLLTTYIDALPNLVNKKTGRIHTSYNQAVTATGRLSSTDPNLQNIPARTELGQKIREAFVAAPGYKLVALDYSQIELRIAAHMSGDKMMIEAFRHGDDIHTLTAAAINEVSPDKVTKTMRREAKATNFGILYGQGSHGLAQAADISYARAKEFIEKYFHNFAGVKKYIDNTIVEAREKGYTETMFGRRRYLPEINSSVMQVRKGAERMAINTPIQGTAADMIKVAMIEISQLLSSSCQTGKNYANDAKILLQVHDELLFEIKEDKIEQMTPLLKDTMENVIQLKVPIIADVKIGDNWGEMVSPS